MKKVLVGMSGGVDSSVAAYLLQQQGYEVIGIHFTLNNGSSESQDVDKVCRRLNIFCHYVDLSGVFNKEVLTPVIEDYKVGKTPNICVLCNKKIKFGEIFTKAKALGCDFVATGHYCSKKQVNGSIYLQMPKDCHKDQTYFLSMIPPDSLKKTLFPLSGYTKQAVREIALQNNIPTAQKKDSSDVCLAEGKKFRTFLSQYLNDESGDIIDLRGDVVGKHKGLYSYTIGQRKGLDIGGKSGEDGRWFVVEKDYQKNALIVSHGDESILLSQTFTVSDLNFFGLSSEKEFTCLVKTRYRMQALKAQVFLDSQNNTAKVVLSKPERAVTIGQYAVFYDGDICLGGGKILSVDKP